VEEVLHPIEEVLHPVEESTVSDVEVEVYKT